MLDKEIKKINDDQTISPRSKRQILSRINRNFDQTYGVNPLDKTSSEQYKRKMSIFTKQELMKIQNLGQGNCPYCLTQRVLIIGLDCNHAFCTKCCVNLIKITKIKKGLTYFIKTGEEIIKCPKCHQINILTREKHEEILDVREYEA